MNSSRREFLKAITAAGLGAAASVAGADGTALPEASASKLPPWRGFNLLNKFNGRNDPFEERDFEWLAELGFNFVRLPMDYHTWIQDGVWTKFREATLKEIDHAVDLGARHGIHVCLNFQTAGGKIALVGRRGAAGVRTALGAFRGAVQGRRQPPA
jgi:endoglucanase